MRARETARPAAFDSRAHWATIVVMLAAVALAIFVRVRLADVPLERDEGEYAYSGRLILHGVPPYALAYNMKFPGTYYAYALIMGLFGQSPRGIHLGLALVNVVTAWVVFVIARRLLGEFPAAVAAVSFLFLSLDRWVMGVFAHATHFVLLPALAGLLLLLRALDDDLPTPASPLPRGRGLPSDQDEGSPLRHSTHGGRAWRQLFLLLASGVLLGIAVLMKQHALFYLPLGAAMVLWGVTVAKRSQSASGAGSTKIDRTAVHDTPRASKALEGEPRIPDQRGRDAHSTRVLGIDGEPRIPDRKRRGADSTRVIRTAVLNTTVLALGAAIPLAVICVVFVMQGVLGKFWFWTFQYAREYVSETPVSRALPQLFMGLKEVTRANLSLWLIAGAGVPALWLRRRDAKTLQSSSPASRPEPLARVFLTGLLIASFLALCPGFYFREHYFILLLPALALFIGVFFAAVGALIEKIVSGTLRSRGSNGWRTAVRRSASNAATRTLPNPRLLGVVLAAVLFAAVVAILVFSQRNYLFSMSPRLLSRTRYGSNPFIESVEIAKYIRERTDPTDRIAVLGSEPEIYFYADRMSATGYIYVYALMEPQRYASRMQEEMIVEIESAHPKYLVFAQIGSSWLARPGSDRKILEWGSRYMEKCYDLVGIADIVARDETRYVWDDDVKRYQPATKNVVFTLKRKSEAPCVAPH